MSNFAGFSQQLVWINDTANYCLTEPQARFVVKTVRREQIQRAQIINLQERVASDSVKIKALETKVDIQDTIIVKKDGIIEVVKEREVITKKQLRKEKWKAVGEWFRQNGEKLAWGVGGFLIGGAVGTGAGLGAK